MTVDLDSVGMDETSSSAASLRFLLLGDIGVGKSAFVNAFVSSLAGVQSNQLRNESIPVPATSATLNPSPIHLEGVHVTTKPILQHDDSTSPFDDHLSLIPPKVSIPARELTFATIPGYSSTTNPSSVLTMTDDYLNHHLHSVTSIFSPSIPSSQLAWFLIAGSRAHTLPTCAFYFVLYELKPIDILYMKMIHEKVNLVPVITKADTLSQNELWVLKRRMVRQLKLNGIKIHTFGRDMDTIERMVEQRQWGGAPFVVSTRRNSEGRLYKSELQDLINITLYERVRHLQEDAAQKVVAWKKAFGPVGNVVKTSVEQVWTEKETSNLTPTTAPLRRRDTRPTTGLVAMTVASPTQLSPPPSVLQQTQPTNSVATHALPLAYAPPPSSSPASPPVDMTNPANFGLPAGNYAPPPSFTNGSVAYTSPPPSLTNTTTNTTSTTSTTNTITNGAKPAVNTSFNGTPIGLVSPPPSSSNPNPFTPTTSYAPPPRTTSSSSNSTITNQARLTLINNPGMTIDGSTRPSELMEAKAPGATLPSQDSNSTFMENYVVQPGSEASVSPQTAGGVEKVEIPNSEMSYQPSTSETTTDLSNTLPAMAQLQQQPSFLTLPSFQTPAGAFLMQPSELYQAAVMSTTANGGEYGNMPDIWEAAELGDLATVQMHLNNGVSPDQRNNSRSTLLHRTAWQGVQPYAVMKLLISYGANVNLVNENGNTVLQNVLMKHDDPSLIKLLLDNGAEAMVTNKEGMNTLEVAALFNKLESARYLLENDMSSSDPQSITNALQRARSPDKKAMKTLLKSWQGREGERKRFELADKLRAGGQHPFLQQQPSQASDAASIRSFETTKEGKSSKWLKLKF